MSGGHFNYDQYRIGQMADEVEQLILNNDNPETNEWGDPKFHTYPPEIIEKFHEGLMLLLRAQIYAQRIDWLVSGDDGEDAFLRRLREDLEKLNEGTT